jgi:ribonuclease P/MRP protein subunit POP5
MVRFKNRHILVEFLQPSALLPAINTPASLTPLSETDSADEDEDFLQQIPEIPFLLPLSNIDGSESRLKLGDEGGGAIYRAIRGIVQDVYGDEGWGRISSSFKCKYHLHSQPGEYEG